MSNKEYQRKQKQAFRARTRTFSLSFPKSDAADLDTLAIGKGYNKTSTFLKDVMRGLVAGNGYVVPNDGQLLRLERQLRKVGTNVNMLVRHVNVSKNVTYSDIQLLQRHLAKMEIAIQDALTQPPTIEALLQNYFTRYPLHHQRLIDHIKTLQHDNQD